jgi:hypothetical protein
MAKINSGGKDKSKVGAFGMELPKKPKTEIKPKVKKSKK